MSTKVKIKDGAFEFDVSQVSFEQEQQNGGFEEKSQIRVLSFLTFSQVSLEDEIVGKSKNLEDLAYLSLINKCIIFCGIITSIQEIFHMSVAVFNKGSLIDIVDRTANVLNDNIEPSDKIKIFSSDYGKIGLLIDKDVLIPSNWQKTAPNCDIILSIAKTTDDNFSSVAYLLSAKYDIPFLLVTDNAVIWKE